MYCACCEAICVLRMLLCHLFDLSVRFALRIGVAESVGYCPDHGVPFPVGQRCFRSEPHTDRLTFLYEGCPESILPFWISREPIAGPCWNMVASQMRPYCASVNSHCPVGLVSRQWDAVDWACILCDLRIHNDRARSSASRGQCACSFYSSRAGFLAKRHITQVCQPPYSPDLIPFDLWLFPKLKSPLKGRRFVNATVTQCTRSVNGVSLLTD